MDGPSLWELDEILRVLFTVSRLFRTQQGAPAARLPTSHWAEIGPQAAAKGVVHFLLSLPPLFHDNLRGDSFVQIPVGVDYTRLYSLEEPGCLLAAA
jgi:hypothetical protein